MPDVKPHWASDGDTYVQQPPDQLRARGFVEDDTPAHNEENWKASRLQGIRLITANDDIQDVAAEALDGQVFLVGDLGFTSIGPADITPTNNYQSFEVSGRGDVIVQSGAAELKVYDGAAFIRTFDLSSYANTIFDFKTDGDILVVSVYTSGLVSKIVCFNYATGAHVWTHTWNSGASAAVNVIIADTQVYAYGQASTGSTHYIAQLNRSTGVAVWTFDPSDDVTSAVVCRGYLYGTVSAAASGGDLTGGTTMFTVETASGTLAYETSTFADDLPLATDGKNVWALKAADSLVYQVTVECEVAVIGRDVATTANVGKYAYVGAAATGYERIYAYHDGIVLTDDAGTLKYLVLDKDLAIRAYGTTTSQVRCDAFNMYAGDGTDGVSKRPVEFGPSIRFVQRVEASSYRQVPLFFQPLQF